MKHSQINSDDTINTISVSMIRRIVYLNLFNTRDYATTRLR